MVEMCRGGCTNGRPSGVSVFLQSTPPKQEAIACQDGAVPPKRPLHILDFRGKCAGIRGEAFHSGTFSP
jgi:hypothetical protein